jgi:hypothetical protein
MSYLTANTLSIAWELQIYITEQANITTEYIWTSECKWDQYIIIIHEHSRKWKRFTTQWNQANINTILYINIPKLQQSQQSFFSYSNPTNLILKELSTFLPSVSLWGEHVLTCFPLNSQSKKTNEWWLQIFSTNLILLFIQFNTLSLDVQL